MSHDDKKNDSDNHDVETGAPPPDTAESERNEDEFRGNKVIVVISLLSVLAGCYCVIFAVNLFYKIHLIECGRMCSTWQNLSEFLGKKIFGLQIPRTIVIPQSVI